MAFFQDKRNVLAKMRVPDKSRAGRVDECIRDLIGSLNKDDSWYTTSSCAGRIIILEESPRQIKKDVRWLLSSHEPVTLSAVKEALDKPSANTVWLKCEPFYLSFLLEEANRRLEENKKRVKKFETLIGN